MRRSMFIGLVIALLLQVGVHPTSLTGVSLVSHRVDWMSVQAATLTRLVCGSLTFLTR